MNLQQKISAWLGCILFSVSNLWPPWAATYKALGGRESFLGCYFVLTDFGWSDRHIRPDFSRLILEDTAIVAVTLVAVLTLKGQSDWRLWPICRRAFGRFSRYQQAALVLTLLSVGVMLASGAPLRLSLGILLLGLTLAWVIGSDNRLLHYSCLAVGLAILVTPAGLSWRQHRLAAQEFGRKVQAFEANIPRLAQRYPLNAGCPVSSVPQSTGKFDPIAEGGVPVVGSGQLSRPQGEGTGRYRVADVDNASGRPLSRRSNPSGDIFDFVAEEQIIPIDNSSELHAVLTQMNYPESEKESIEARFARDLDSKKIGRAEWVLPCLSNQNSKVHFQISAATGSEFLDFLPPWFMNAVVKGVNITSVPANEKPGSEPPPFQVLPALWSLPLVSFLGVVIGSIGGANLFRLRRKGAATTP